MSDHLAVLEEIARAAKLGHSCVLTSKECESITAAIALMRGQSEPVAWVTPEWLVRLVRRDPIIERSIMFLPTSRVRTPNRTIALYAAPPRQEPADEQ